MVCNDRMSGAQKVIKTSNVTWNSELYSLSYGQPITTMTISIDPEHFELYLSEVIGDQKHDKLR